MSAPITYEPRLYGARCDECWLREHRDGLPVGPELNPNSLAIIVGEAPGETEIREGRPFTGKSGGELTTGLAAHGIRRSHVSFTNALLCLPTGGDNSLDLQLHKLQKENKRRTLQGLPPLPSPFDCCKPRLQHDLAGFGNVIAVGKRGAEAVLGHTVSIMGMRGGPIVLPGGQKVMPTLHPAFIMRMRRWTKAFRADLGRAMRWFRGQLSWRAPRIVFNPTPEMLRNFLRRQGEYAYDTETKSPLPGRPELAKDPLLARLGLFGIATDDEVHVVSYLGVDGVSKFYTPDDLARITDILREWGTNRNTLKIDFNGYYDVQVIRHNLGFDIEPRMDCILLHRDVEPELPHGLGYVASVHAEIPSAWKIDHAGTDAETDQEWREYNATDCVLTYRVKQPLMEAVILRKQQVACDMHHAVQRICIGLHQNGVWANPIKRKFWDDKLRGEAIEHLRAVKTAMQATGLADKYVHDFNPGSVEQLKDLFYTRWAFTPVSYSKKTGEPSTDDESLREWLRDPKLLLGQRDFISKLRRFRATTKLRGNVRRLVSYLEPVPKDPLSLDEDEEDAEKVRDEALAHKIRVRISRAAKKMTYGQVLGDGRVHSHFNAHSVVSGWRTSSNDPNVQNWSRKIREIIAPQWCPADVVIEDSKKGIWKRPDGQPFRVFMYADADQGEMRITAAFAGVKRLLDAFKNKKDPHAINGEAFFGKVFTEASKTPREGEAQSDWDRLRDFSKTGFYALVYGASLDTIYETITSAEDANGNLPFVNYSQRQVRAIVERYLRENPELPQWWENEQDLFRNQGFLADPLFGYRCDFLDGDSGEESVRNKILNFRSQSLLGAIVKKALVQLTDGRGALIPFGAYGHGTGLVLEGHDRGDFEMPVFHERRYVEKDKKGKEKWNAGWCVPGAKCCPLEIARQALTEAFHQHVPGLDVEFTGEGKVILGAWT